MNGNPDLNNLLKWSVQNSGASNGASNDTSDEHRSQLTPEMLQALLGGPSDADLMRESMVAITSTSQSLDNKIVAFDNFEQLIENLDNANNMEALGLWMPLVDQLKSEESEIRRYAAWCISTAVQNNVKAQERLLSLGALPKLTKIAVEDDVQAVRKKAITALSSATRNYQPGLDAVQESLPQELKIEQRLDAADMESVDILTDKLRELSQQKG